MPSRQVQLEAMWLPHDALQRPMLANPELPEWLRREEGERGERNRAAKRRRQMRDEAAAAVANPAGAW